jgi:hypothetical protein
MNKVNFKTKLSSCVIESDKLSDFIGKEVEITVIVKLLNKKNWSHLGSQNLGGKMDNINIRDYANE